MRIRELLGRGRFENGRLANPIRSQSGGKNKERQGSDPVEMLRELNRIVIGALTHHQEVRYTTLPRMIGSVVYTRHGEGMQSGPQLDTSIVGDRNQYRTDISIVVFLSAPDEYEGEELIVHPPFGQNSFKLPAGTRSCIRHRSRTRLSPSGRAGDWPQRLGSGAWHAHTNSGTCCTSSDGSGSGSGREIPLPSKEACSDRSMGTWSGCGARSSEAAPYMELPITL